MKLVIRKRNESLIGKQREAGFIKMNQLEHRTNQQNKSACFCQNAFVARFLRFSTRLHHS